jgi:hypothetical protein
LQEQVKLESKDIRSNVDRIGSYVQGIDCELVSGNITAFWEANTGNEEGPLSQSKCSGPESIWPPFEYSDVFCFTSTLSMHMHAELKSDQDLNYNVKKGAIYCTINLCISLVQTYTIIIL